MNNDIYTQIINTYLEKQNIKEVANICKVSVVKVRKVLITENLWTSRKSLEIQHYLNLGYTTQHIADVLCTTEKAVQQYLPYTRGLYGVSLSHNAINSALYRSRIKILQTFTNRKKKDIILKEGWNIELQEQEFNLEDILYPQYPGIVYNRKMDEAYYKKSKFASKEVVRVHLELLNTNHFNMKYETPDEETLRVLRLYGHVAGTSLTRDVLVPAELPLFALNYVIQGLFGWQNCHLHHFFIDEDEVKKIINDRHACYQKLVGVLFRSSIMDEEYYFCYDDYEKGSFKNWLKTKYTAPYYNINYGEGYYQCYQDIKYLTSRFNQIGMEKIYGKYFPTSSLDQEKVEKIMPIGDMDTNTTVLFHETYPFQILERLTIKEVLAMQASSALSFNEQYKNTFESIYNKTVQETCQKIIKKKIDKARIQPPVSPFTNTLYYTYDYGDGWVVRITASKDCCDLIEEGKINDQQIEEAMKKLYKTSAPVCIYADGYNVLDDVGGIQGYISFLRAINNDNSHDNGPYEDAKGSLQWAKIFNWSKRQIKPINRL